MAFFIAVGKTNVLTFFSQPSAMNSLLITLLFVVSSALPVYESKDVAGYEDEKPRSMLRKAEGIAKVVKKESHRGNHGDHGDSIAVLEEASSFNEDRVRVLAKDCSRNEQYFKLDLQTDDYGFENSWTLKKRQDNKWAQIQSGPPDGKNYSGNNRFIGGFCLSAGNYKFTILDLFKDGMCCSSGDGKYAGYVDGTKRFSSPNGESKWEQRVHNFSISTSNNPPPPTKKPTRKPNPSVLPFNPKISTTKRETEWLESHNTRRKSWHKRHGETYVPLKWSNALKNESKKFAEKLLRDSCGGLYHDPDNIHGENLASNGGSGSLTTDSIVTRWVEDEADDGYPGNGHLTQVLWRATKYVGCAEASRSKNNGGMCQAQVCRYSRPGNCNMSKYKTGKKDWWKKPMLMADSPCGPACPPDGCQ
mmetsp:Transcript_44278/g.79432  ORF Transcript_44278/g.79432 Transcript_44278/m.79432 type:complete len:418 (-) Transcript_44278:222-1475(-)